MPVAAVAVGPAESPMVPTSCATAMGRSSRNSVTASQVWPPHNQEVALQPKALGAYTDWHLFHVGVAAALSNPPSDVDRVTDRMLTKYADLGPLSYRGEALGALDGGYLVGLGLLGHLRALSTWQIMNLLSHKHELLLIRILLGTAAAYYAADGSPEGDAAAEPP
ncbi:hypothetical protein CAUPRSCDRAFT_12511 [Caulochytrium protostelioides]|uniref:Anaphase-promoting complex subunit 1 n=1 Tax=Caulochytrium protostelioides TaxID=1555241 RepID=A0A4V1IT46_9FUNG|nr:hypothetical protein CAUPRSCDRAFT_12511 [Caulochytrium protostelioides]